MNRYRVFLSRADQSTTLLHGLACKDVLAENEPDARTQVAPSLTPGTSIDRVELLPPGRDSYTVGVELVSGITLKHKVEALTSQQAHDITEAEIEASIGDGPPPQIVKEISWGLPTVVFEQARVRLEEAKEVQGVH